MRIPPPSLWHIKRRVFYPPPYRAHILAPSPPRLVPSTETLAAVSGDAARALVPLHPVFGNPDRSHSLSPNKKKHFLAAGRDLTNWLETPGYAYTSKRGKKMRMETRAQTPTATTYGKV